MFKKDCDTFCEIALFSSHGENHDIADIASIVDLHQIEVKIQSAGYPWRIHGTILCFPIYMKTIEINQL